MASLRIREERYALIAEHVVWELSLKARENIAELEVGGSLLGFRIELHEIEMLDIFRITPGQVNGWKLATEIGRCLERVWDAIPWGKHWTVEKIEVRHGGAVLVVELRGFAFP